VTDSQAEADPIYLELLEYKKANSVRDPVTTDERKISLLLRGGHTIDNVSVADFNATNTLVFVGRSARSASGLFRVRISEIVAIT
jgi:hypothetical protein